VCLRAIKTIEIHYSFITVRHYSGIIYLNFKLLQVIDITVLYLVTYKYNFVLFTKCLIPILRMVEYTNYANNYDNRYMLVVTLEQCHWCPPRLLADWQLTILSLLSAVAVSYPAE